MNPSDDNDDSAESPKIPYRRDRTPSIVVQSLGLSFQKDSAITGSIEMPDDDSSTNTSDASDPKSSTSGIDEAAQIAGPCDSSCGSAKGSLSSLQNSSSPAQSSSPVNSARLLQQQQQNQQIFNSKPDLGSIPSNRRLSLNIGSTAPRRQSLTVDGLSSASFINPSGNATGSLRNKVALKPGHSLMGWIKLASTAKDLSGTGGKIMEVTPEELAKHDKEEDCWVALKGNVYNVTTYLHYHPGGIEELMRGAGRDATELFNEVHRWVNYESILAKCLVGPYKMDSPLTPKGRATFKTITEDSGQQQKDSKPSRRDPTVAQRPNRRQSIALTVPSPNKYQSLLLNNNSNTNLNQIQQPPTYVIMQDKSCIKVKIQDLTLPVIRSRHLICDLNEQLELHISIILSPDWLYRIHLRLDQQVDRNNITADLSSDDRVIVVQLNKLEQSIWNKIGTSLNLNDSLCEMTLADKFFRPSQLISKKQLTHDTYLFEFKLNNTLMYVPIGWHVLIREHVSASSSAKQNTSYDDTRIYKNYTPVLPTLSDHDGLTDESGFMSSLYFIIKIYQDGVVTGKLTQLNIGDIVDISDYQCVDFDVENSVRPPKKHWLILAAGTGLTPFCRIIPHLLSQPDDLVESVTLVFFNKTQEDIIWRDQFDSLAIKNGNRFKVVHVLSNEPEKRSSGGKVWMGKRGRISKDLLAEFVDSKSPDELQILSCGPRAFTQLTKSISNELNLLEKLYIFHG
uniref:Cytochrome b5 reductase 4 n=1 Tax=Aceria tosichella TaxID=561515 RepID=A0A6G1SQ96_9ACAR